MKHLQFIFVLLLTASILNGQNTVGTISVESNVYDGYTLFSIHKKVFLINNCGEIINEWTSEYLPGNSVYLLPNGNILRAGEFENGSNINLGGIGGIVEMFDWEGNLVWSYVYSNNEHRQHHDVYPMPNGNVLILAATVIDSADAIQAGRDPLKLTDNELYNEQIIEVEPVGLDQGNIVWEWNVIDHVIQDIDPTKDNFGVIANQPRKLDINFLNGWGGGKNWLHINSIQYDELRDQIVIGSRQMSELWIIDHSTTTTEAEGDTGGIYGHGGDFLYRWGNPQSYDMGDETDRRLYGQHTPYYIPSGLPNADKIMIFNNGFGRNPFYSEVMIINPPTTAQGFYLYNENTAFGPLVTDFSYPDTAPIENSDFFSAIVSNAQQLPNGNILICEGREGHFFEIDTNNNIVWDYLCPISSDDGEISSQFDPPPLNKLIFRANKYGVDYPAFVSRDLTPSGTIEPNSNTSTCQQILGVNDLDQRKIALFPNPAKDYINVDYHNSITNIEVFNIVGESVLKTTNSNIINIENLRSGLYLVKITSSDGERFIEKILKK